MTLFRGLVFNLYFYGLTFVLTFIATVSRMLFPGRQVAFARAWIGAVLAGARLICGIQIVVSGRENLPASGPALLASQHQSALDTLIWMRLLPAPAYVIKHELTRIPLFGRLLTGAGMIPVDRKAGAAALRSLLTETERARDAGRQIVIFPEGTRVPPGQRAKLQPGIAAIAMRLGLPVIPVATDSGRRWGRGLRGKVAGRIHIAVMTPIPPGTPRAALLEKIEASWAEAEAAGFRAVDNPVDEIAPAGGIS